MTEPQVSQPYFSDGQVTLLQGHVLDCLRALPSESVQCVITSPPYWALRSYGTAPQVWGGDPEHEHEWGDSVNGRRRDNQHIAQWSELVGFSGGIKASVANHTTPTNGTHCPCGAWRGELGHEPTPQAFVAHLVEVFREVRRVLKRDGVCFVNIGDSYNGSGKGPGNDGLGKSTISRISGPQEERQGFINVRSDAPGLKAKDLVLIPERFALAMQDDGWFVRSRIAWCKKAPMPESVRDRPTNAWEHIWMFTKSARYFWDADAVREASLDTGGNGAFAGRQGNARDTAISGGVGTATLHPYGNGRNMWSYWLLSPDPEPMAHFACVDEQTQALTPDGWRFHKDLSDGDAIAAYDPDRHVWRWDTATFHRYPYQGDMVVIDKRDSSQRLTPNHRCLVRDRYGKESIVLADDLGPSMQVPTAAAFDGESQDGIGISWAALVGWFITEGSIDKRYGDVMIYQSLSANPAKCERIRQLLTDVGATWTESVRERDWRGRPSVEVAFRVDRASGTLLKDIAPEKAMTPALAALPPIEAAALLEALIDGDGHRRCDGRTCIIQKDKRSIDLMQVLALKLGYRAHVGPHGDGFSLYLTRGEWLTLRGTNGVHDPLGREHYEGTVWCPSVPTGFWIARRNGKPFITGNTFPREVPRRCIAAATREGDTILDPFVGSGTTTQVARSMLRRSIGIDLNETYLHDIALKKNSQMALIPNGENPA